MLVQFVYWFLISKFFSLANKKDIGIRILICCNVRTFFSILIKFYIDIAWRRCYVYTKSLIYLFSRYFRNKLERYRIKKSPKTEATADFQETVSNTAEYYFVHENIFGSLPWILRKLMQRQFFEKF